MDILAVPNHLSRRRLVGVTLLAWVGVLGFDLILHGAILSSFYVQESPFLLPPLESFRRIPLGYLSFLITTIFLAWLVAKLELRGWRRGMVLGSLVGGVIWISLGIGMYSISTAPQSLLFGWVLGQTLEMAYAGAVIGQGFYVDRTRKLTITVLLLTLGFIVLTFILQSVGLAQAVVIS
jgi:hypothetical protein